MWQEGRGLRWRDVDSYLWNLSADAAFWRSMRTAQAEARGEIAPVTANVDVLEAMRYTDLHHLVADLRDRMDLMIWARGAKEGDTPPDLTPRPGMKDVAGLPEGVPTIGYDDPIAVAYRAQMTAA